MSALNFPSSPATNQIYTANGKSWRFDGTSWKTYYILNVQSGGTGNTFYNLGDILVGAGTSLYPLPVGSNNYVLTADNSAAFGVTWKATAATGITTLNSLTATSQYFSIAYTGNFPSISSAGSTHTFNIPIAGTGATGLVSTLAQSFAGAKTFTNDLLITSSTVSTSTSTGALTVTGGVGIGGSLYVTNSLPSNLSGVVVNNGVITSGAWAGSTITAYYGGTGYNSYSKGDILVGAGNTFIKLNVGSDNYVLTASSTSATGLVWSPTAATGITTLNGLNVGIQYLSIGYSGSVPSFASSGSTHTLNIPLAGSGSTGLISTQAQTIAGQKTFTSAIIGDLTGTATTAGFASTASYAYQSGYGITSGLATTAQSISIANALTNSVHYIHFSPSAVGPGIAVSTNTSISFNPSSFVLSTSGLAVTNTTASTSSSSGALIVSGGVGIGQSLNTSSSYASSISGVVHIGGVITYGSWAGSTITSFYGGTGFQTYSTGDLIAGAGSTLIKVSLGTNNNVLVADSTVPGGIKWANVSGFAITNINGLTASKQDLAFGYSGTVPAFSSSGATHTLNIPLAGTGSTGLVSTQAQSFAGIKTFTNAVNITDTTGSGSYNTGALVISGGVGIGGTLNVQGDLNVQGTFTTINSTTITVADKNIELGVVAVPTDLTAQGGGITLRGATDKSINWYSGAGWSSSESWNLAFGNTYKINNTTVLSSNTLGTGVIFSSLQTAGIITSGTWSATAITALYGGTGLVPSFTVGDILYANTSNTWARLAASSNSGYVLASAGSGATPAYISPVTLSVGFATTAANINIANASSGVFYPILSNSASSVSGLGASVNGYFSYNTATGAFGATSVNIASGQSYSINSNSVISATSLGTGVTNSYLTALGTITTGTWSGSLITAFYGGTGYNTYTKGDILVGSGNTFIKLNVGTDNYVLTADATSPSGVKWSSVSGISITSVNNLTASAQFFATGVSGTGFNISSSGSTHTFNIPIAGTGATGLVSTLAQSFAGTKTFTGDVIISSTTGSTAFNTGALTVYGGLGVSGQLSFNQAALGFTGANNPSMAFIGSTTAAPITLTVLSDNSLIFEGTSGKLFGINNNLSTGWIFNVGDISGLPIIRANADGTIAMAEFAGNVGIGLTNPSYKLHVVGDTNLSSGYVYRINGTSVLSATSLGTGVTNSYLTAVGTITTGVWSATAVTAFYGGTGYQTYSVGDLLVGAGSTLYKLPVGTNNYVLTADSTVPGGIKWAVAAATGITTLNTLTATQQYFSTGTSGTGFNISSSGSTHTFNIPIAGSGATGLVSTQAQTFAGQKTFTSAIIGDLTGTATTAGFANTANYALQAGYAITSGLATTATLALTISSVSTSANSDYNIPFLSGTALSTNSNLYFNPSTGRLSALLYTGSWAGNTITSYYGGTGYQSYSIGDLLVGAGSTLYKLPVGTNSYVLTADSASPGGIKWAVAASTGVTTINALTTSIQYFSTGTSGTGFNISSSGSTHTFNIPIASTGNTGLVSTLAQSFAGIKTFTNDTVISSSTVSISTSSGALTVTGGVGIGGSLYTGTSTADSISGVVLNNGIITSGSWSATAITARYGGTGNSSYTLGDLLVGAGSTFIKLPVGINGYILGADSAQPSGVGWTTVTPLTVSTTPPANPKNADLWFNSQDGGLLVYYKDGNSDQWVEIALGSGIDLSQAVHITSTTPSTSTTTGALIVDGGAGFASTIYAPVVSINGIYDQISSTLTTSTTSANQVAMSLDATIYRTIKIFVQVTSSTSYHSQEVLMVHDGSLVYMTEYAIVNNGSIISTFDADISGGNIRFLVTPTNAVTTYKVACSAMRI